LEIEMQEQPNVHLAQTDGEAAAAQPANERSLTEILAEVYIPPTVSDNSQHWAGMDGAIAFHLIERHADNWADVGKMMNEWLTANGGTASSGDANASA
jgi:hypothetical protein